MNVNNTDIVQGGSTLSRLWYQATGRSWEAQAEGGPTAEFDTQIGTDLNDLKVKIQYQQDLHGYDYPWPAGGGVNKFNINAIENKTTTNNSIVNDHGVITVSIGEASTYNGISTDKTLAQLAPGLEAGKTYMLTVVTTGTAQIYLTDVKWESGTTQTLTEENLAKNVWLYASGKGTEATITAIQIEEGTTQTDPVPYENKCPITGYDEAEIYLEPEYDAEADPRYTIDLDDTRYSGTIDITTGEMVLDMAMVDLGTLTWRYDQASLGGFDTEAIASVVAGGNNAICSLYPNLNKPMTTANIAANDVFFRINKTAEGQAETGNFGVGSIFIKDTNYSDATAFKTAMDGVQLLYELADPLTVQLDPTTVTALTGHNVLWCNTGDVISVDYNII